MIDPLDEIYQYLDKATRYGRYITSLCPFHDENRPSFFIYPDSYFCKSCGAKGKTKNLLDDLKKNQGTFIAKPQIDFHSPWSRWSKQYGDLPEIIKIAHRNLVDNNKTSYLSKRGIDVATTRKLKLGWLDDWITFPIYDPEGEIVGATTRAGDTNRSQAKYCNYPGQSPDLLYVPDWSMVEYKDKVFLVYGIIDAISIYQLGYASLSTTTGKRTDPECLVHIRKRILIIPDHGEEIEASLLSAKLGWRGKAMKVDWPENTKDCNDLYLQHKDLLVSLLEK